METIYDRIQKKKREKGIKTDKAVEEAAGLSNSTIQNIKRGIRVRNETIYKIATVLDTTADYLISGVEAPQENEASEMDAYVGKLVSCLSRLNEKNRKMLLELAEGLLQGQ